MIGLRQITGLIARPNLYDEGTPAAIAAAALDTIYSAHLKFAVMSQQAIRVLSASAHLFGVDGPPEVAALVAANFTLHISASNAFTWISSHATMGVPLGWGGVAVIAPEQPLLYYDDWTSTGASVMPAITIAAVADLQNLDAVNPHSAQIQIAALVEIYSINTGGLIGLEKVGYP